MCFHFFFLWSRFQVSQGTPIKSFAQIFEDLTALVSAARAAVATGAWVKSKHMYLIRGIVGAKAYFLPIRRRIKEKVKIKKKQI